MVGRTLGLRRTDRAVALLGESGRDVNLRAIPVLLEPHIRVGVGEVSIGGDAPKVFVVMGNRREDRSHAYVAKAPAQLHAGARECATEYLIARIGRMLPLKVARGRLVILPSDVPGAFDVRFMSRYFLGPGEQLEHGIELVARCFDMPVGTAESELPRGRPQERKFYTFDIVDSVLESVAESAQHHAELRSGLVRMLAFDAMIGANDRHPRNWGLVSSTTSGHPAQFSPVFDTARGLFWNESDDRLRADDKASRRTQKIASYAEGSRPLIGLDDRPGVNHFDLMDDLVRRPECRPAIAHVVMSFDTKGCERLLHREFSRIFTRIRLSWIYDLLCYRAARMRSVLRRANR